MSKRLQLSIVIIMLICITNGASLFNLTSTETGSMAIKEKDLSNINIKENSRLGLELRHLDSSNSKSGDSKENLFIGQNVILYVVLGISTLIFLISCAIILCVVLKMNNFKCCKKKTAPKPRVQYFDTVKYSFEINDFGQMECAICLDVFTPGCDVHKIHSCGHLFHTKCIQEYDRNQSMTRNNRICPLCKAEI